MIAHQTPFFLTGWRSETPSARAPLEQALHPTPIGPVNGIHETRATTPKLDVIKRHGSSHDSLSS